MTSESPTYRFAVVTAVLTFVLVLAGGLVTSRDAGLAVPDWPLSFGSINPPRWYAIDNVRTEHGHRVIAFCAAVATVLLGIRIRRSEVRPSVRLLGAAAVFAVLAQALLGGLRVLHLSVDLAMIHGWFGQIFFAILVSIVTLTSSRWPRTPERTGGAVAGGIAAVIALIIAQLMVGIWIRHQGLTGRPLAGNPVFFVHGALALSIVVAAIRVRGRIACSVAGADRARLESRCVLLLGLLVVQMLLGIATFGTIETMTYERQASFLESWVPTFHVATGAAILATAISLGLHAFADRIAAFDSRDWATHRVDRSVEGRA